jgi:hypothetical protein
MRSGPGVSAPGSGPLTDHERYLFDVRGYVVRRGVLSANEVDALNTAVDLLSLPEPGAPIQTQRFSRHLSSARCFRDLIDHAAVFEPVLELCGEYVRLDHAYGIVMNPGQTGLGLHGGGTPHDPAQFYDVRAGRIYNGLVAAQWALVDHGAGMGGFGCIPGSHRANFGLPSPVPLDWVVEVPLARGDVVIFTEGLTHCTLPWRGSGPRRTLLYKYAPGHLAWGKNYSSDLADLVASGNLTPRQQVLMDPPSVSPRQSLLAFRS